MNTLNTYPNLPGSPAPFRPDSDRADLSSSLRPALVGLAILFIGFGLMLLASLLQQESSTSQPDYLELPLPMPAGNLMALSVTAPSANEAG